METELENGSPVEEVNLDPFIECNTENYTTASSQQFPDQLLTEPCLLGIDEAGRGPVLGPMVYGTCFCPIDCEDILKKIGCADSKTLSEDDRERIFKKIHSYSKQSIGWMVTALSPHYISTSMLQRSKYNLNEMSHDTAIELIRHALDRKVKVTKVFVDTVGDPQKYQDKLQKLFPAIDITVSKKADSLYPVVSAASICAKVVRDRLIRSWKFTENVSIPESYNYGSGYPGDPNTKKFLKEFVDPVFGFSRIVRFSWETASKLMEEHCVPVCWDDDEENEKNGSGRAAAKQRLETFFKSPERKQAESVYFRERKLQSIGSLFEMDE